MQVEELLNNVKSKLSNKLTWKVDKDLSQVAFYFSGKKKNDNEITLVLETAEIDFTVNQLRDAIIKQAQEDKAKRKAAEENELGELTYLPLPEREAQLDQQSEISDIDRQIWKDIKFVHGNSSIFYIRDDGFANTYTINLSSASTAPQADARALREAFFEKKERPDIVAKAFLSNFKLDYKAFSRVQYQLPATCWSYFKIKAYKKDEGTYWDSLVIPSGSTEALYKGFLQYEDSFREDPSFYIPEPVQLTNDPKERALAFIDLQELDNMYKGQTSTLWDNFLLQRFHKPEYVSIFKAWTYAIAVGKNNSRQEMFLYGAGSDGKGCLCKAFVQGFNKLAGKDICLSASKSTGQSNFNSELLNKHLLIYPDAKNLKSGMSEFKHNVTGGDFMRIEGKGREATSAIIYMKCLTCANELPKCDMTDRSQKSRYIILPFSLSDDEMKQYGLMDAHGQTLGSDTFQTELDNDFDVFLASCREHYLARCKTNSNIDAHEAEEELASIEMDEEIAIEDFIDTAFEITDNPKDRIAQKDFRTKCITLIESEDLDTGVKLYKDIKLDDVRTYLERKHGFRWKAILVGGKTVKGIVSTTHGIKLRIENTTSNVNDLLGL